MKPATARLDTVALQAIMAKHLPLYHSKMPHYQAAMLGSLLDVWDGPHDRLLDIGGGTGVVAEAISRLFPVKHVHAIDLVDRFCPDLSISTSTYDGRNMPFTDRTFHAATLNNVLHHVPAEERVGLLREIRRVVHGPLYIKDHIARSVIDHWRLAILDAIGNIPFGGMIKAHYLSAEEWRYLAAHSGWRVATSSEKQDYRSGLYQRIFPNRLEITMRFDPA